MPIEGNPCRLKCVLDGKEGRNPISVRMSQRKTVGLEACEWERGNIYMCKALLFYPSLAKPWRNFFKL